MDATQQLFGATGCGIMIVDETSVLAAVAATDEAGRRLEVLQQQVGHGPCVDALTFDQTVTASDLASDGRWPALAELPRRRSARGAGSAAARRPGAGGIAQRLSRSPARVGR